MHLPSAVDEQIAEQDGRRSIAQRIRQHRESIIRAWEAAVRELPVSGDLPTPILRDEMPEIVDRIAVLVDHPGPQTPRSELPERHALQRLGIGFALAHVLMEYSVLRNCILEATAGDTPLSYRELVALNDAIDTVANRSVERFSQASERLLKALDRISAEALQSKSLDDLLHRLLRVLMQASPAVDSVAILLANDGQLRVRAAQGLIAERDPSFSLRIGEGFSGTIAERREPMLSRSAATDPLVKSDFIKLRKIQALYGVPLIDVDIVGVAHMGSLTVHDFTHEEKLLFQAMAQRATVAIVHTQLLDQLEAAHDLLVATVQQMPIGVIIRDAHGQLIAANAAAERMLRGPIGVTLPSPAAPRPWRVIGGDGRELAPDAWPLMRAVAGEERHEELTFAWDDGTARTFDFAASPIRDRDGRVVAGVVVFQDITELKQAEQERELYISSMSHDLRSPLSVVTMATEQLLQRDRSRGNGDATALERIARNARQMDRLIQQLLDFARSRHAGGIPLHKQPTDLAALCRHMIDSFQASQPARRVRLDAPPSLVGYWDGDRLAQMVQNLIGNAFEHGLPDAPVEVSLGVEGECAVLRVSNRSERPIPPELLPRLFDPFRRGSDRGGLGLGLYICQQIARAHGAEVRVSSDAERTTFIVCLPLR